MDELPAAPADSGGVTEWLMVADCKSAGLTPYVGSNPTPTMVAVRRNEGTAVGARDGREVYRQTAVHRTAGEHAGVAQLVEHQPSKLRVAGSSPVARFARMDGWADGQADGWRGGRRQNGDVSVRGATVRPTACPPRGCSSVGRASAFQAEGRGFESRRPL